MSCSVCALFHLLNAHYKILSVVPGNFVARYLKNIVFMYVPSYHNLSSVLDQENLPTNLCCNKIRPVGKKKYVLLIFVAP